MLRAADVFVVCAALTTETAALIGARELALMKTRLARVAAFLGTRCKRLSTGLARRARHRSNDSPVLFV
jgi:hypothetical protein